MSRIDQEYLKKLDDLINADFDDYDSEDDFTTEDYLEGNVKIEDIRDVYQELLYLVIDKSVSMHYNGLEDAVRQSLADVKRTVNGSEEESRIQTAMTFFGSTLDMRPFQYGECIDISYSATENKTRLYDAVVESCKNMISQYDKLKYTTKLNGVMLIFTDGDENGSGEYDLNEVQFYLNELEERDIKYCVAAFKGVNVEQLSKDFKTETIIIEDKHRLRRFIRRFMH